MNHRLISDRIVYKLSLICAPMLWHLGMNRCVEIFRSEDPIMRFVDRLSQIGRPLSVRGSFLHRTFCDVECLMSVVILRLFTKSLPLA